MADMGHSFGPCNWPAGPCPDFYGFIESATAGSPQEQAEEAEAEAAFILWVLTGQRYGVCEVVVTAPPECFCTWSCDCRGCSLLLPAPVKEVLVVEVNGDLYENWVQRGDAILSSTPWPRDVTVTYLRGIDPPAGAARAVSELAREIALATCNPSKCRIPPNLVRRTFQGDTIDLGMRPEGKTGLTLVDLWIEAANGINPPAKVWSPDCEPMVAVTTTPVVS